VPGWPTVDRAHDLDLVKALRRGDPGAPERLYDAYGDRLHDYAASLLGDLRSADAVHDAVVTAQGSADRLREPARFRAWLYALVRFQAMARLGHHRGNPAHRAMPDDPDDPELSETVGRALGGMRASEREILELSLRHGLAPAEVAAVLGLTSRQVAARLRRSRDLLENAAAAVLLARSGRAHCPDLSALLDSWEGALTPELRRRLTAHVAGCEVCTERRRQVVSAARLMELLPVAYAPFSLRERVLGTTGDPAQDDTRTMIVARGDELDRNGFPVAPGRRHRAARGRRRGLAPVLVAVAALLAGTTGLVALTGGDDPAPATLRTGPATSPAPEPSPSTSPSTGPEQEAEPSPTPTPREHTPTPRPTRRTAAEVSTSRPPVTAAPTRRRGTARPARLTADCPPQVARGTTIGLRARNATVSWKAVASDGLAVVPAEGSIKPGGTAVVWVTVNEPETPGTGAVTITSNGGRATCTLRWTGTPGSPGAPEDPDATEPPGDEVTLSPGPGETRVPEAAPSSLA
jgi:RNA polymerase sigma factor (sigma-70 family)